MCLPETFKAREGTISRRNVFKLAAAAAAAATLPSVSEASPLQLPRISRIIDLTHVLGTQTPTFPGLPGFAITPLVTMEEDGVYFNQISQGEHIGTHIDAPNHFSADGLAIHEIPVDRLVGPLAVIDIRERVARDPDTMVMPDDILAWERRYGRLPRGAIVIMNSGWATRFDDPRAFLNADVSNTMHFPGWSKEATDLLMMERSVNGIGVDTLSLDRGVSTGFEVHYSWLPSQRWGLELVANLASVPPSGALLIVGAPTVYSGSGGPSRLIAVM